MGRLGWCILRQTDATENEMGVGYAQMCIKTAVYVNQEGPTRAFLRCFIVVKNLGNRTC